MQLSATLLIAGAAPLVSCYYAPRLLLSRPANIPVVMVDSWYDTGLRLDGSVAVAEPEPEHVEEAPAATSDLAAENEALRTELEGLKAQLAAPPAAAKPPPKKEEKKLALGDTTLVGGLQSKLATATKKATEIPEDGVAKDVQNTVAVITAAGSLAAMGVEIGSIDVDLIALGLGAGAAVVAEEDTGVAGQTLRAVGTVATPVAKVTADTVKATADYAEKNDIGWKARAILELGVEAISRKIREGKK